MSKPPRSVPSLNTEGADQSASKYREPDPKKGTAADIEHSDAVIDRPDHHSKRQ